jgi:lipoyl(octanoyl) transferase
MNRQRTCPLTPRRCRNAESGKLLQAYLLGSLDFDALLRLQRSLAFHLAEGEGSGALVLCEHPPLITVGRDGNPSDVRLGPDELTALRWGIRWVPRGGGCLLHLPGQLAVYPILALERLELSIPDYLDRLQQVLVAVLADFGIRGHAGPAHDGVRVGDRLLAALGVAVRGGISHFGAVLNVDPDVTLFRHVHIGTSTDAPMTSLARERKGALRAALVRQRLIEHFADQFGFARTELFFHPPGQPGHQRLLAPAP